MAAKKSATKKAKSAKPKATKADDVNKSGRGDSGIPILPDHIYRGPHHGKAGVSDFRVLSVEPGTDGQGKQHRECVTGEWTKPPNRQEKFGVDVFRGWVRADVTKGYEDIPKSRKAKQSGMQINSTVGDSSRHSKREGGTKGKGGDG